MTLFVKSWLYLYVVIFQLCGRVDANIVLQNRASKWRFAQVNM